MKTIVRYPMNESENFAEHRKRSKENGFTLIELLVTTGIIGTLASIAIPLYSDYLSGSFESRVRSDLRHVALAEEAYFVDYQKFISCTDSGCATALPGVLSLSEGVTLAITGTNTGFTGTATHSRLSVTCEWDSAQGGMIGCS